MQPINLYFAGPSPNPWKVAYVLEELSLPYTLKAVPFTDVKGPEFTKLNPNGRLPAIEDPNTGLTLWESGAIIEYLVEQYDKDHKISFDSLAEKNYARQFLHFQMSGQGPYYGQAVWFQRFHPEKLPSAVERYQKESKRVATVLDGVLAKNGGWLVGNKCSYADISFLPWGRIFSNPGVEMADVSDLKHYNAWIESIAARPAIKKVLDEQAKHTAH